jgi:benzoylformate decarboxylase
MTPRTVTPRPGTVALYEQLRADGITWMFGNPGTVEQGFLDELERTPDVEYLLALQETVALGIADGYARATGGPALVQLHTGVGLGNGIGMLYQSMRGHTPLVVVAGEAGTAYTAMDSQMAADLVAMARPVTKHAMRVEHPGSLLRVLRRAIRLATTPPCGPVFVALPMDVLDALTDEPAVPTTAVSRAVTPVPADVERAVAALAAARRPVVLMGDGVAVSGAQAELTHVAELLGAPVWGVEDSEVNMAATHPLYRGRLGHMFGADSERVVAGADAVLVVGTYLFPEVFPSVTTPFDTGATVVHVDLDVSAIAKNHPVDVALAADPRPTLAAIADGLLAAGLVRTDPGPARTPDPVDETSPLLAQFTAELVARAGDDLVVVDEALTGSPQIYGQLLPSRPGSYHQTRGGSLGIGIPGAIGVKLARPDAEVVGFTGDGGSMYTVQALWSAARYGVAARFVICNNGRYRLLDLNIDAYRRERGVQRSGYPSGFDLSPEIDFAALAASLGVAAVRVEKPEQVAGAVERMLAHPGPFLVDLATGEAPS